MVYRRRRLTRPKRKQQRPRKRVLKHHEFSEMFVASPLVVGFQKGVGPVTGNAGQVWTASIASIPQYGAYKALYNQYRIKKIDWLIMPQFTGVTDPNTAEGLSGSAFPYDLACRLLAIRSSTNKYDVANVSNPYGIPTTELGFLQDNSCRVYQLNRQKPIRLVEKWPKAQYSESISNGTATTLTPQKNTWMNFDDPYPSNHGNLMTLVVTDGTGNLTAPMAQVGEVYARIHFCVRDAR